MQLGVNLIPHGDPTATIAVAVAAEQAGFTRCLVYDEGLATHDVYVMCTAIAAATHSIQVGPGISDQVAEQADALVRVVVDAVGAESEVLELAQSERGEPVPAALVARKGGLVDDLLAILVLELEPHAEHIATTCPPDSSDGIGIFHFSEVFGIRNGFTNLFFKGV